MELNAKKYIDFVDQALDLDSESKRKTTWIVIRILNILMTIELAIFLAERFGYPIILSEINLNAVLSGFKNYDIIVGITFFILTYYGIQIFSWLLPIAFVYTQHWANLERLNERRQKFNKLLDDEQEFALGKAAFKDMLVIAKYNTARFKLILQFCVNLYLTNYFLIQTKLSSLYSNSISALLSFTVIIAFLLYVASKDALIKNTELINFYEHRNKFIEKKRSKLARFGLNLLWIVLLIVITLLTFSWIFIN